MPLSATVGHASFAGPGGANQDFAAAATPESPEHAFRGAFLALADGVGKGQGGGALAEHAVRSLVSDWYATPDTWGPRRALEMLFSQTNLQARQSHPGAACTLTALALCGRTLHLAHVGDSRAVLLRESSLRRLTVDHVWDNPDFRNVLHRAIGLDEALTPQHASLELSPGDVLLLCSDGIHAFLTEEDLAECLHLEPEAAALELAVRAGRKGSHDDCTALVCRIDSLPAPGETRLPDQDTELPPFPTPLVGVEVDNFRLVKRLGQSRNSQVWLCTDLTSQRECVLKIPAPFVCESPEDRLAFLREEWVGRRIQHPSVVPVLSLVPGRRKHLYYAMPCIEGHSLREELDRHPGGLEAARVCDWARELCDALLALHRQGVLHGDLKPDNLLLDHSGKIHLIDLGISRIESLDSDAGAGTPSYMAPELFEGAPCTEASEVFALGVTLHELLTGRLPWGEIEPFQKPRFGPAQPPSRWNPSLPAWIETLLLKCLAVNPDERYEVVTQVIFALERQHLSLRTSGLPDPQRHALRRRLLIGWSVVATVLALLEGLLLLTG